MNQRDRIWIQREWIHWANWVRDGRTVPNALGYKSKTVEYSIMRGETGGDAPSKTKVPTRFRHDNIERKLDKVFWGLDQHQRFTVALVFVNRKSERDSAHILGVKRHHVRQWLQDAYKRGYQALTPSSDSPSVVNG